jgi:glycosyltransferase involved in cell wall biosynthesis
LKAKLWIVTTVSESLYSLLQGQPKYLNQNFVVTIISSPSSQLVSTANREQVSWKSIKLTRTIAPIQDLLSLWKMFLLLRKNRPDIIQSYTPKAGLITMTAARLAGVPVRIHGIVGMPLMEARGIRRSLMKFAEKLTYLNATALTCNSFGLRDYVNAHLTKRPIVVIGTGSINGVDVEFFAPDLHCAGIRAELGIADSSTVFVYVGRLVPDKGIVELVKAFTELALIESEIELLLVGDEEHELTPLPEMTRDLIAKSTRIHKLGWQDDVRPFMSDADVFVLPSYREGLPNSVLEAGAMALPSIVTDINGCNEVVEDGANGIIVPPKDFVALKDAMMFFLESKKAATAMGQFARDRVIESFEQNHFWHQLADFYQSQLHGRK